jgi:hypothetical protein
MKKEIIPLSEKIGNFDAEKVENNLLWSKDVKEFIKDIKQRFSDEFRGLTHVKVVDDSFENFMDFLRKRAGDKLR